MKTTKKIRLIKVLDWILFGFSIIIITLFIGFILAFFSIVLYLISIHIPENIEKLEFAEKIIDYFAVCLALVLTYISIRIILVRGEIKK